MKHYDLDRDPIALGQGYCDHVMAMTAEGLHSKADIAAELAWRDQQINSLSSRLEHYEKNPDTKQWILDELQLRKERNMLFEALGRANEALQADNERIDQLIRDANDVAAKAEYLAPAIELLTEENKALSLRLGDLTKAMLQRTWKTSADASFSAQLLASIGITDNPYIPPLNDWERCDVPGCVGTKGPNHTKHLDASYQPIVVERQTPK